MTKFFAFREIWRFFAKLQFLSTSMKYNKADGHHFLIYKFRFHLPRVIWQSFCKEFSCTFDIALVFSPAWKVIFHWSKVSRLMVYTGGRTTQTNHFAAVSSSRSRTTKEAINCTFFRITAWLIGLLARRRNIDSKCSW